MMGDYLRDVFEAKREAGIFASSVPMKLPQTA